MPKDIAKSDPKLVLEEYFAGDTKAWGLFMDRFGKVRRQFTVDVKGTWDGETLKLVEDFIYDDGEIEQRIWKLNKTGADTYEGTADGVVGKATGSISGNAFNWEYTFDLKMKDDKILRVHFDDWMYLQEDGVVINKAVVTKLGFKLGEAIIVFKKE